MDQLEVLKVLLNNDDLMKKHNYSKKEINKVKLTAEHENEFIRFMQVCVQKMYKKEATERVIVNDILKAL